MINGVIVVMLIIYIMQNINSHKLLFTYIRSFYHKVWWKLTDIKMVNLVKSLMVQ